MSLREALQICLSVILVSMVTAPGEVAPRCSATTSGPASAGRVHCRPRAFVIENKSDWFTANKECHAYSAQLLHFRDAYRDVITSILNAKLIYFVGASRNNSYKIYRWLNGQKVNLTSRFGPSDWEFPMGLCLAISGSGKFQEVSCASKLPFICHFCSKGMEKVKDCACEGGEVNKVDEKTCLGLFPHRGTPGITRPCKLAFLLSNVCEYAPCGADRFGDKCERLCHCENMAPCHVKSGSCEGGKCADGWSGAACNETNCNPGYFGRNCDQACHCANGQACHGVLGDCQNGCAEKYSGPSCSQMLCDPGHFGPDCTKNCHCEKDGPCPQGICPSCKKNWQGQSCNETRCPLGNWGSSCDQTCTCMNDQQCDVKTGSCGEVPKGYR